MNCSDPGERHHIFTRCTVRPCERNDQLHGGDGDDLLRDESGENTFSGGAGDDIIYARSQEKASRTPDASGVGFWIAAADRVTSLEAIAAMFIESDEFATRYANTSAEEMVTLMYHSALHRTPDEGGLAF